LLSDGSALELFEDTRVEVCDSRATESGINTAILYLGRIWATIAKDPYDRTAFEIETPTAVAGVRGTEFSMAVGIDGATRVGVDHGLVEVSSDVGAVELPAGKETVVEWNRPPDTPRSYRRDEGEWRQWVQGRQQKLIENHDMIVPWVLKDVKNSRKQMMALRQDGDQKFKALKARAERRKARGKQVRLTPREKKALAVYFRQTYVSMRNLQRSDRRMMSRYYLLKKIQEDAAQNPDQYSPEFTVTINQAVADLDQLDIRNIHRENRMVIDRYASVMQKFAEKHEMHDELKRRSAQDRRAELQKARKNYRKRRPE
jgi:hypothetical protein